MSYLSNLIKEEIDFKILNDKNRYALKAMPLASEILPGFVCAIALTELNTVLETVQHTLANIDNIGGQDHLESVQNCWNTLNELVKDQCSQANANISHYSNRRSYYTPEYHIRYYETFNYYESESFKSVDGVLRQLKLRMLELQECGCVTEDSYHYVGEGEELELKKRPSDFQDAFKTAFRRWRVTYKGRIPLNEVL